MAKSNGSTVNCYDQAAAVTVFGRLLGINVQYAFSEPFGYINTTTLVGSIVTNDPFNPAMFTVDTTGHTAYPRIENVDAYGNQTRLRTSFGNHAYAVLNGKVYDACAGPVTGMTLLTYYDTVIDFEANKQWNQYLDHNPHLKLHPYYYQPLKETATEVPVTYYNIGDLS